MSSVPDPCPSCGRPRPAEADRCPACGALPGGARASLPSPPGPVARAPTPAPGAASVAQRIARLAQWAEAARPLGVELPTLPPWAEAAVLEFDRWDAWLDGLAAMERRARREGEALAERESGRLLARLVRLEAYSIDARLERIQLEEASRAARSGDLATALWTFPQLERVVAVKERLLDQARTDLESLLGFLHDLDAIGLPAGEPLSALSARLEADLRAGRFAPLRQSLRTSRTSAVDALRSALPELTGRLGERLLAERERGLATPEELRELVLAGRAVYEGAPEEGAHRLRRLAPARGIRAAHRPSTEARSNGN